MRLPTLWRCAEPGCKRLSHLRYCPTHADDEQRTLQAEQLELLIQLDVARTPPCDDDIDRAMRVYFRRRYGDVSVTELRDRLRDVDERLGIRWN